MCRYRSNIHISGPPSRQLACCTHGRSHTRSPHISIMRVDSRELPLSAVPLCQLLPCHLWPRRPTLSLNLYVKGCLDCTFGAFHTSGAFSPSEWGPDPQCLAVQVNAPVIYKHCEPLTPVVKVSGCEPGRQVQAFCKGYEIMPESELVGAEWLVLMTSYHKVPN